MSFFYQSTIFLNQSTNQTLSYLFSLTLRAFIECSPVQRMFSSSPQMKKIKTRHNKTRIKCIALWVLQIGGFN